MQSTHHPCWRRSPVPQQKGRSSSPAERHVLGEMNAHRKTLLTHVESMCLQDCSLAAHSHGFLKHLGGLVCATTSESRRATRVWYACQALQSPSYQISKQHESKTAKTMHKCLKSSAPTFWCGRRHTDKLIEHHSVSKFALNALKHVQFLRGKKRDRDKGQQKRLFKKTTLIKLIHCYINLENCFSPETYILRES